MFALAMGIRTGVQHPVPHSGSAVALITIGVWMLIRILVIDLHNDLLAGLNGSPGFLNLPMSTAAHCTMVVVITAGYAMIITATITLLIGMIGLFVIDEVARLYMRRRPSQAQSFDFRGSSSLLN